METVVYFAVQIHPHGGFMCPYASGLIMEFQTLYILTSMHFPLIYTIRTLTCIAARACTDHAQGHYFCTQLIDCSLACPCQDKLVYVDVPNAEAREEILRTQTRKLLLADDVNLRVIASDAYTTGFTGADLAAVTREAGTLALRRVVLSMTDEQRSGGVGGDDMPVMSITANDIASAVRQVCPLRVTVSHTVTLVLCCGFIAPQLVVKLKGMHKERESVREDLTVALRLCIGFIAVQHTDNSMGSSAIYTVCVFRGIT